MYCDGSLDEGEYTVEALMLSRVQGGSRKTFLVLRVSTILFYSWTRFLLLCGSGSHFFSSQTRIVLSFWHYVNLFPFFLGLARTFSILGPNFCFYTGLVRTFFLVSDPGCSSLLALCQPFSILYGSGTRFFSSGTSPFPSISPGFQFV